MAHRLSPEAEADLDAIWFYLTTESGYPGTADRLIDAISRRFVLLAAHPHIGRRHDELRPGLRTFWVGVYAILYRAEVENVLILRVLHGNRDIAALLRE